MKVRGRKTANSYNLLKQIPISKVRWIEKGDYLIDNPLSEVPSGFVIEN